VKEEKLQTLAKTLTPGVMAIFILMIVQKPDTFFQWMQEKTILYTIFMFFYVPVAKILIRGKYDKSYTAPLILGIAFLIPYSIIMNLTLYEVVVTLLQTVVTISVYSTIFNMIEEKVEKWV